MLARGHRAMGHRVYVAGLVGPDAGSHPFLDSLAGEGVEVAPIILSNRAYLRERAAVREICRRLAPSVLHTHGYRSDVVDAGVGRTMGVPVVTTVHGFTGGGIRNRVYERLQEHAFRRFDAVVAVSTPIAHRLRSRGVSPARVHVVPNAFDSSAPVADRAHARRMLGIPSGEFAVGWVGRLSAEKGPDIFVDAISALSDSGVSAYVLGDGPDRLALEERSARLGAAARIHWRGIVHDAGALMAAFDVLVLSSRTEGVPIVLLEAAAAGTPIVATRVGGVPDMFSGAEAILVSPEDSRALAAGIASVRTDAPEAARRRTVAALARLGRDFGPKPWLERYEALYHSLAGAMRRDGGRTVPGEEAGNDPAISDISPPGGRGGRR